MSVNFKSQYGQDQLIASLFPASYTGFYIDSGAGDGVNLSNTYYFEQQGWSGICIEPNNELYAKLIKNRKAHCLKACLYTFEGDVWYVDAGVLSGIDEHISYERLAQEGFAKTNKILQPAIRIENVLRQFGPANKVIDYWSLDTEGSELEILETFPFGEYKLLSISVEHNWNMSKRSKLGEILYDNGLLHVAIAECDDIYAHKDLVS